MSPCTEQKGVARLGRSGDLKVGREFLIAPGAGTTGMRERFGRLAVQAADG